jgi:hypothetical protein
VQNLHARYVWGYDPVQLKELEEFLADTIRAAVAEERERCVNVVRRETAKCQEPVAVSWLVGAMIAIREGKP